NTTALFQTLSQGVAVHNYAIQDGLLRRKGKLVVGPDDELKVAILQWNCLVCQANKSENAASPGLLQPLPIPQEVWVDISMDFIGGLPVSFGKTVIFVVVDRFSKYAHFMALSHPYTALEVAQSYLDCVFKLHGWPRSIVSDRDAVFLSNFWRALFELQGTDLLLP
uniref:Integrase catalytic domain-containing protein n=1 Tax=Chenopodium quinoa TaxID=63459 RepID=A0A803L3P1_CHEQI